jgi:ribosome assembly protein 4
MIFISARLVGHQQLVNDVRFSPDTRILASASFDKSIRLWDGRTGKYVRIFVLPFLEIDLCLFRFITTLRGHVQAVYMVAWSADSRLLVSGSADSTLKGKGVEICLYSFLSLSILQFGV